MVELKLGYGEQDREAQKMLAIHQLFGQDPAVAPMYGLKNRHAMLKKILEQQGILNVDEYLVPPEQIPPPQPDPAADAKPRWLRKQLELQERQTGVAEMRAQTDAAVAQAKINLDAEKAAASHALQSDNQDLREAQFAHKVKIDEGELEVLRRKTTEVRGFRGIASPRVDRKPSKESKWKNNQETLVRMGEEAEVLLDSEAFSSTIKSAGRRQLPDIREHSTERGRETRSRLSPLPRTCGHRFDTTPARAVKDEIVSKSADDIDQEEGA